MNVLECIKTRMSIRKFKPKSASQDTLKKLIGTARWSPPYKNLK
jgi:nitroreductase